MTAPNDIEQGATGILTDVAIGQASATDPEDGELTATAFPRPPFRSGRNIITWTATDSAGRQGSDTQQVDVLPQAEIGQDRRVSEGASVTVPVRLSGYAPEWPVTVPFTVSGTATPGSDHNLNDGSIQFVQDTMQGTEQALTFDILNDADTAESAETIIIELGTPTNAVLGPRTQIILTIGEDNLPPTLSLAARQADATTRIIRRAGGPVSVTARADDANAGDALTIRFELPAGVAATRTGSDRERIAVFDPAGLPVGPLAVVATVDDGQGQTSSTRLDLDVVQELALSSISDTDKDGLLDAEDGSGDLDNDGVPNFADDFRVPDNHLQAYDFNVERVLATDVGNKLSLGRVAFASGKQSAGVSQSEVEAILGGPQDDLTHIGRVFDFEVGNLEPGQTVRIVVPLFVEIPSGAVYRKFTQGAGWQDFSVSGNDQLHSGPNVGAGCPPPGDSRYVIGLNAGHRCIQLTMTDGGPNDADGQANGRLLDPSGLAVQAVATPTPPPDDGQDEDTDGGGGGGGGGALGGILLLLGLRTVTARGGQRKAGQRIPRACNPFRAARPSPARSGP